MDAPLPLAPPLQVLAAADLDASLHAANDPRHWRAVATGRFDLDGHRPIVLYYNKATKQATFDEPRFAAWQPAAALRNAAGRKTNRSLGPSQ
jgi:hypothetical protein